jgi:DNA/RNA endonuclease G (NUC1)/subtilisin family serine protease
MMSARDQRLKQYLRKISPSGELEGVVEDRIDLEVAGAALGRPEAAPQAASAVEKLARDKELTPDERFSLEAIIIPDKRPAIDVVHGEFRVTHALWQHLNDGEPHKKLAEALASIGRIELPDHPSLPYGGTGFVVGDELLMTNRHVAELFTSGLGLRRLGFLSGRRAGVDFLRERDRADTQYLDVTGIVMIHPYWDMALLKVQGLTGANPPLRLSLEEPEELVGSDVALIGYPAFDSRNPADVQSQVFGGVFNVKRLQPGKVGERATIDSYGNRVSALTHDSSTLGGNSGSAAIDVETGDVVGLHFAGLYLLANYGVPSAELGRDARVVDAGVRFSGTPSPRSGPADVVWWRTDDGESAVTFPTDRSSATPAAIPGSATWILPLEVTMRWGPAAMRPAGSPALAHDSFAAGAAVERMVEPYHEADYKTRHGYDPMFLGVEVALPTPLEPDSLARNFAGSYILPYHHFSLAMHKTRRLALFTASNLDASPACKRPEPRPDRDYSRDGLGGLKRNDRELWFPDPRIRAGEQLPDRFFSNDNGAFDRGHLVRREDVAWGTTYNEVRAANGDTFHVTNCSPQVADFNQSRDTDNWGDLENLILDQADEERLCVFAGPVLDDADPTFVGMDQDGPAAVQIPSRYWKVITAAEAGELQSFGFVLEQDLSAVPLEFAVPASWRRQMFAISEIERLARVRFPRTVREADQAKTPRGAALRRRTAVELAQDGGRAERKSTGDGAPLRGAEISVVELEPLLAHLREVLAKAPTESTGGARFVLNFVAPPNDSAIADAITSALRLPVEMGPLFAPDPDLDRYRLLVLPRVGRMDRADLFDLAKVIRVIAGAETVDPDLGTDYYDWDREQPPPEAPEGADFAFWCWADGQPSDVDWAIKRTGVPDAWAFSAAHHKPDKGRGILIFQPDTGVVPTHTELPPNAHEHPNALNLIETGSPPVDAMQGGGNPGHGTATGSVVASPEQGRVRGAAPLATLVPVRCIETVAVIDQSPVAQAIDHSRRSGAHVISMSLGGVLSSALHAAVRKAVDDNVIVIAAAGNCVFEVVWPARYDEVIAVGGINERFAPWRGSCRGPAVDISGPAEFVLRADPRVAVDPNNAVSGGQGTSFAAAHLAGVAALWLAHHERDALIASLPPGVKLQHVFRQLVRASATTPPGFDTGSFGAGIVNAATLLGLNPATAFGAEAVATKPASDPRRQVADLLDRALGPVGAEAARPALADPQNAPELACLVFDRLRAGRTRRAQFEAVPPRQMSAGMRRILGERALALAAVGDDYAG